jgi:glycosyltransferase involved in cell wall biosynthesis
MKVEVHIVAWNEAETIALTIKHYKEFSDNIIIHDNHSDDDTVKISLAMGCQVRVFGTKGVLDDRDYTNLKNNCWKGSTADWVILVDADEILDVNRGMLAAATLGKSTIFKTYGWNVFIHNVPRESWVDFTDGFHDDNYSKWCIFDPKAIKEINYVHGCHVAKPKGDLRWAYKTLTLFHYRNVGGPDRLVKRHAEYRKRLSAWNIQWKAGDHYNYDDERRIREWEEQYAKSTEYFPPGS